MLPQCFALLLLLSLAACGRSNLSTRYPDDWATLVACGRKCLSTRYSNDWAIIVSDRLTASDVEELAKRPGLRNHGQVSLCVAQLYIYIYIYIYIYMQHSIALALPPFLVIYRLVFWEITTGSTCLMGKKASWKKRQRPCSQKKMYVCAFCTFATMRVVHVFYQELR